MVASTGNKRHNYKKLIIWQLALEISYDVSDLIGTLPHQEMFNLRSQLSRCSISMPSNIAEGSARSTKSFSHFIDIALGSSFELGTQLLIAYHRRYLSEKALEKFESKIEEFQRMTMSFQNRLTTNTVK